MAVTRCFQTLFLLTANSSSHPLSSKLGLPFSAKATIVGLVREVQTSSTKTTYRIADHTGLRPVSCWIMAWFVS